MNAWKRITTWVKSIGWVTTLGTIGVAVLFALAATRSTNSRRKGHRQEGQVVDLLNKNRSQYRDKAKRLSESAARHKQKALDARLEAEIRLEELGSRDEDIDDITDRYNSHRVRVDW